ncbi:tyrosine-type recombinase/integrase [Brevibacterium album]|uniref:tyrosine-type recombinase/integrase n=1 Tax=Brevibacterium album TaxID=417948 RepID=UPI00146FBBBA|nr:tyrosine-type recombinase/integrase [Brevibacterium album]
MKDLKQSGEWTPGCSRNRWKATASATVDGKVQRRAKNFPHVDASADPTEGRGAAEEWAARTADNLRGGTLVPTRATKSLTVADVWNEWLEVQKTRGGRRGRGITAGAAANYEGYLRNHVGPAIGEIRIADLRTSHISSWTQGFPSATNPVARDKAFKALKSVCQYALRKSYIQTDPCIDIDTGRNVHRISNDALGESIALTRRQADRLVAHAGRWATLIRFALATGCRWGEVIELRRRDLDLPFSGWGEDDSPGIVRVSRSRSSRGHVSTTKNGKPRDLPIPASLVPDLRALVRDIEPDDLVFRGALGGPMPYKAAGVLPVQWDESLRRGRTGRGKGVVANMQQPPRKPGVDAVRREQRGEFGRIVLQASLLVHDAQRALYPAGTLDRDHIGNARFGPEMAAAVAAWQDELGAAPAPDYLSSHQLSLLLDREVGCDLQLGDADWQRPLDLRPKAERPEGWDERTFGFHDLRHTAATLALEGGVPPHVVQAILDHGSAEFVLERYAEITADGRNAVAAVLNF